MVGIKCFESYFPVKKKRIADLIREEGGDEAFESYFNDVGIEEICLAEEMSGYDLAKEAGQNLLEKNSIRKEDVDVVILIQSRLPDSLISSEAARLQFDLGLPSAQFLSVSGLGCADMTMAIKMARDFLLSNFSMNSVLICFGSKAYVKSRFRYPVTINGDGGIAMLISRETDNQILDVGFEMNGKYWDLFSVDYKEGGFESFQEKCKDFKTYGFELAIESRNVFSELNSSILERNELAKEDIDHFVMQNISSRAYQYYGESLNIKLSPVCSYNLGKYGHLGPMDIIMNLKTGVENGLFQKDNHLLIMNNSPVAVWTSLLIKI